jgi:hypothetical protein
MSRTALMIVQVYFPDVKKVVDADEAIEIEVTKADNKSAKVRNHNACALAVSCKRTLHLDGVIVSINTAYLIKGNKATRYKLPESVSREIVSFDREGGFDEGSYKLNPVHKGQRLGERQERPTYAEKRSAGGKLRRFMHRTNGVRAALGSKIAPDGITHTHS